MLEKLDDFKSSVCAKSLLCKHKDGDIGCIFKYFCKGQMPKTLTSKWVTLEHKVLSSMGILKS